MEKHVKTLGVLWIVYGGLGILLGILTFALFFGLSFLPDDPEGPLVLISLAIVGGGLLFVFSVPEILAGCALLKFKEWGRILALVVAFLNVIWFPIGTALSVYTFVILMNQEAMALFKPK